MTDREEILTGGNINEVVKVGETIRRQSNRFLNDLLLHLEKVDCPYVPRYLGTDNKGREIFSYLEGVVPGNQYPETESYMWSDAALIELAKILRAYHDAAVGFITSEASSNAYPDQSQHEVICHNDAALYNVVFKNNLPVGIIDFDMAGPGPRMWDIAYTLYTSVPLAGFSPTGEDYSIVDYDKDKHALIRNERIKLFFSAYGIDVPMDLKKWVITRIESMCTTLTDRAAAGEPAFVKLVQEGHLVHYQKELLYLEEHFDDWM